MSILFKATKWDEIYILKCFDRKLTKEKYFENHITTEVVIMKELICEYTLKIYDYFE